MNLDSVLLKFNNVEQHDNGRYYTALCPGHDDQQSSLTITPKSDKILLHCHAKCDYNKILTKAGLGPDDLRNGHSNGHKGAIIATYDYRSPDSRLLYQSVRYEPKTFKQRRPDGNGGYIPNLNGVERVLYRLPELIIADESQPVFIVEGEKDADRLASLGLVATTNVCGAGKWKPEYNQWLTGRNIVILPDNDQAGQLHALRVGKSLDGHATTVKIIELPDLPPKGDVSDWINQGHTGEELLELAQNEPISLFDLIKDEPLDDSQKESESEPIFKLLTFDDLMNEPDKEQLIGDIIARGYLGMMFGESEKGKTIVMIDMILAAVLGQKWAGCFDISRPLNVAYCAGEGLTGLKKRFATAAAWRGVTGSHLGGLMVFQNVPQLFLPDYQSAYQFVSEFKRLGRSLDLLIIDTLHTAIVNADENSSKDAGTILAACRYLIQELDCALLLVHHTNKAKSGERGSSAYRGAMDIMLEVSQEGAGERRILCCSKNKDGERFQPQAFGLMKWGESVYPVWEGEASRKKDDGTNREAMLTELVKRPTAKLTAKQWGEAIGISQAHANNVLGQLVKDGKALRNLLDEAKPSSNRNPWVYGLKGLEE